MSVVAIGFSISSYIKYYKEYKSNHFAKNSTIFKVAVGDLTPDQAYNKIVKSLNPKDDKLDFVYDDKVIESVNIPYKYDLEELKNEIHNFKDDSRRISLKTKKDYNQNVQQLVESIKIKEELKPGEDAKIIKDENSKSFLIQDEVPNEIIDLSKLKQAAVDQVVAGRFDPILLSEFTHDTTKHSDDPDLNKRAKDLNDLANNPVNIVADGKQFPIEQGTIFESIQPDGSIDKESFSTYVSALSSELGTNTKPLIFTAHDGHTIEVANDGSRGWYFDTNKTSQNIADAISNKQSEAKAVIAGNVNDDMKLTNTYAEVDLDNQHLYVFKDGNQVVSTDVVTGDPRTRTDVGVFQVGWKQTPSVLRGVNGVTGKSYETPVNYWVQFDGGIGLHDANWQTSFGDKTGYLKTGSNGCVNVPPSQMGAVYDSLNNGDYVIVYGSIYG